MKYLSILFACGIAFLILVALDTIEAQVKQFASFDDFLADVQNTADSWIDYVTKVQAMFCPNQPRCGPDGVLDRQEALGTLPAVMTVDGLTVRLEDISSFAGVCCLPCSCADSCRQDDNCCPTKQLTFNNETVSARKECIAATIRSYDKKGELTAFHADHMYLMTTDCFQNGTNLTLLTNCQSPDTGSFSDIVPVTSLKTGTTYWSKACAVCNNDIDDVMEWSPIVLFKQTSPYFMNSSVPGLHSDKLEDLIERITTPRFGDIIYKPPLSMEDSLCLRKDEVSPKVCEKSSDETNSLKPDWMFESCRRFYNPAFRIGRSFMNIFCLICQLTLKLTEQQTTCSYGTDGRSFPGYITALLDWKTEQYGGNEVGTRDVQRRCGCVGTFDPYLKLCRSSYCPFGEYRAGCQCYQPLQNYSGMPVLLKVKITTRMDQNDLLTEAQLRKLHTALKKTIETTSEHSTSEILTTFQQENAKGQSYLCVVIVRSDPGHDTKLTMKPLLDYLDTGNELEVNVGKLIFSATLTSKVASWTEYNRTARAWTTKAQDMEMPSSTFVQIYDNDAITSISPVRRGAYQVLSRLLYCTQLQLNDTEYFERSGLIIVNVTVPTFSISDYYKIPPSQVQVRVCADDYLRASRGTGKPSGVPLMKMCPSLVISSFAIVMLIRFIY